MTSSVVCAVLKRASIIKLHLCLIVNTIHKTHNIHTQQGETFAVLSLIRLSSLLEKLPVLEPGGKEVALIAESLQVRM